MKRLAALAVLITLLAVAWVTFLDDIAAATGRAAVYQLHRAETFIAYPGIVVSERLRGFRGALDSLQPPPSPTAAPTRRRASSTPARTIRQRPPSFEDVLATMNATALSDAWLALSPPERWRIYTSPAMRPVLLGTRAIAGGLGLILLLAFMRSVGRSLLKLLLAPLLVLWSYRRLRPSESHGTARWAGDEQLKRLTLRKGAVPLVVGTTKRRPVGKRLISVPEERQYEHGYVAAPTGSGKTTTIIAPNVLDEPGTRSVVITDPKGELVAMTYPQLCRAYGKPNVLAVDFGNPGISRRYNPLKFVRDATTATLFANTIVQNTGVSQKDPFWGNINRQIIAVAALDLVLTESDPPLVALANMLAGTSPDEVKKRLLASPAPEARRVAASQLEAIQKNDKLLGAVFTEIAGRFEFLLDADVRAVTAANEIDFAALGAEPRALYLPLYLDRTEFYRPLTACFFANLFGELTDLAKATARKTLPTKVMCYIDEFGVMGRIPNFENRLATIRGYGIGCLMVVQSKSQLDEQYGEGAAKSILQNANTKICLPGVTDDDAKMFSELAGTTTVISTGQSGTRRTLDVLQGAGSRTRSEVQRALMPANDLRTMRGRVLAVLPQEHPILADQRPYYKDRRLRRLVLDPEGADLVAGLRRQYPLPDPGLGGEIPDHAAIRDAIETQQAEGDYVKNGGTPLDRSSRTADRRADRHSAPNTTVRGTVRVRVRRRPREAAAAVPETPSREPGDRNKEGGRGAADGAAAQPDGAAMLQGPHLRVLELMAQRKSNKEITAELGWKQQTIKNYVTTIYGRLGVQTRGDRGRCDAVAIARKRGVISPEPTPTRSADRDD